MKTDLWFSILWLGLIAGLTFRSVAVPSARPRKGAVVLEWMNAGLVSMTTTLAAMASMLLWVLHHPWQVAILWLGAAASAVVGYIAPWPPTRRQRAISSDMVSGRAWPNVRLVIAAYLLKVARTNIGFQLLLAMLLSPLLEHSLRSDMNVLAVLATLDLLVFAIALVMKRLLAPARE